MEEIKQHDGIDNSELEELIKEMDAGIVESKKKEEFLELFKKSQLLLPVILSDEWFEGIEDSKPGDIRTVRENAGFNINYLEMKNGERAVALFTSTELMESTGLQSSCIAFYMEDLADLLKQTDKYSLVVINPFTDLETGMPVTTFLNLFYGMSDEEKETIENVIRILKEHSVELEENISLVFRSDENIMKNQAVNGVFAPVVPFRASTNPDFQKELKYTNILLMPEGKMILFLGDIVGEDAFNVFIAPQSEFEIVEEIDEFTTVWKCGAQPFYD